VTPVRLAAQAVIEAHGRYLEALRTLVRSHPGDLRQAGELQWLESIRRRAEADDSGLKTLDLRPVRD